MTKVLHRVMIAQRSRRSASGAIPRIRALERNYREPSFMKSAEAIRYLRGPYDRYRVILCDLGLAKEVK